MGGRFWWLAVVAMVGLAVYAQPMSGDTWLVVRVAAVRGAAPGVFPQVGITRMTPKGPVPVRAQLDANQAGLVVCGIEPGDYSLTMQLPGYGLNSEPVAVSVQPGLNVYTWTIPETVSVHLVLPDKVPLDTVTVYLKGANAPGAIQVASTVQDGRLVLPAVVPGTYEALILTKTDYAFINFTAEAGQDQVKAEHVNLAPCGAVKATVTYKGNPEQGAGLYLRATLRPGFFLTFHENANEKGIVQATGVPAGKWSYDVKIQHGHRPGSVQVPDGGVATLTVSF